MRSRRRAAQTPRGVLNVAQVGLFVMLKVRASPLASDAEGWNAYAAPAVTEVAGEPLITGAVFADESLH